MVNDSEEIKFQCSGCSQCCRNIGTLTEEDKIRLEFPFNAKEDGSCEKLDENGRCLIYEDRPSICSVERTYEKFWKHKGRTKADVFIEENKICNQMIRQNRLDEKYLIDLSYYLQFH